MKKITVIICICMMMFSLCSCKKDETAGADISEGINVNVYKVEEENISSSLSYTGEIIGKETTQVSAKVSGEAEYIAVNEGDYVEAGDLLMSIDSTTYQLAYNQALAGKKSAQASYNSVTGGSSKQTIAQLEAAYNSAKIAYENALDIYNKQKILYEMGAISQMEFNTYKTNMETAKLNFDSAKTNYELTKDVVANESRESASAGVMQADAALDIAKSNLDNCNVIAPISGYVSYKNINRGQMVSPGVVVFTITDTSSVSVKINVTESVVSYITEGTGAIVDIPSANMSKIEGKVHELNPVKDAKTGLYSIKIGLPNEDGVLKEGMTAKINLITDRRENILAIPLEALMNSDEDGNYVYVVKDNKAIKTKVETGIESDEFVEILTGIEKGDIVITSGKEYISDDNNTVNIVEE